MREQPKDNGDSDSSACSEGKPKQQRTTSLLPGQPLSDQRLPTEADEDDPSGTSVPGPTHRVSLTHSCPASTQRATMRRASQQLPSKRRGRPTASKMHTVGLTSSGRTSQVARRQQPMRKHCERNKRGIHSTREKLTNDSPSNTDVRRMTNQKRRGSAGGSWSRDGSGGSDVKGAAQHHQPMLNEIFRAREAR